MRQKLHSDANAFCEHMHPSPINREHNTRFGERVCVLGVQSTVRQDGLWKWWDDRMRRVTSYKNAHAMYNVAATPVVSTDNAHSSPPMQPPAPRQHGDTRQCQEIYI